MMNNEGPQEIIIPEKRIITCSGCKYYSHQMIKSGMNPIYENRCSLVDNNGSFFGSNLRNNLLNGYPIPHDECPFLKSFERDQKIDQVIK